MGGFGAGTGALFERIWSGQSLTGERGEAGPALLSARHALAGLKLRGNSRASTMIRSALAAVDQALAQAGGEALVAEDPRRCALIAGVSHGALRHVEKLMSSVFDEGLQYASATHFPLTTMNATGGQVSIVYGIKGYNTTFCGAGGALQYAHQIVRDGRQDRAITFGADEVSPLLARALAQVPGLDEPGVAPLGEGAAALVLERASVARARGVQALGWLQAVACAQPSGPHRWADTLARAARLALEQAGVAPAEVAAVISVGHGPRALSQAEFQALQQVFGDPPSLLSAAWVAGLSASALLPLHVLLATEVLRRGELPPVGPGCAARNLTRSGPVLVLHPALGGECHAVLVDRGPALA
jgi:3-oxoacyl-[acyl-carrier-protein] synthase II